MLSHIAFIFGDNIGNYLVAKSELKESKATKLAALRQCERDLVFDVMGQPPAQYEFADDGYYRMSVYYQTGLGIIIKTTAYQNLQAEAAQVHDKYAEDKQELFDRHFSKAPKILAKAARVLDLM